MKVFLFISAFLLVTVCQNCDAGCKFRIANVTYKPLVFERHGSNYRFLNIRSGIVHVPIKNFVIATCQHSGFSFSSWTAVSSVKLFCSKNGNRYIAYDHQVRKYNSRNHQLSCNSAVIQHYPSQVRGCDKLGVVAAYANMLKGNYNTTDLVKVAEFCYDPVNRRTQFVHYIGATRSPYVELQYKYNVGLPSENDKHIAQGKLNPLPYYEHRQRLMNLTAVEVRLQKHLKIKHDKAITFLHGFLLDQFLLPYQYKRVVSSDLNQIIIWDSLKRGNAKVLSNCLRDLSYQFDVDLYSGTSGRIDRHLYFNEQAYYGTEVPKYLWTMARVKHLNKVRGVVVVQLNNPYLSNDAISRQVFCDDICDSVPWLSALAETRAIPSLGYTFCCSLEDAVQSIPELPRHLVERYGGTRATTQSTQTVTRTTSRTTLRRTPGPTRSFTFSIRTVRRNTFATRRLTPRVSFPTRRKPTVKQTVPSTTTTKRSTVELTTTTRSTVRITTPGSTTTKSQTTTKVTTAVQQSTTTTAKPTSTPVTRRMAKRSSNEQGIQNEKIKEIMQKIGKDELTLVAKIVDRRKPESR